MRTHYKNLKASICLFFFLGMSLLFGQFVSIHEFEYDYHYGTALFSPIADTQCNVKPLRSIAREMLKNYYGYLPYWIDITWYNYFQMELLTHISYFAIEINENGNLGDIPYEDRFLTIVNMAHDHGVRVHMTFIIFGSSAVSNFLNNATARSNAINNIIGVVDNYGIEGANIDFEFVTAAVRDSFSLFINDLSTALWYYPSGRKELYLATIAVPEWYPGYDITYLQDYADGLYIMAYDFHWSGDDIAGPVSPCVPSSFWGPYCAARSIGDYKAAGVDSTKIILGLPSYGYDWPTVSGSMGSTTTGSGVGVIYYYAFNNAATHGRLWDDYSWTPWYRYSTATWHQCWYDDSVSLDIKFGMVNDSLLQGAGCWALGYDHSYDHIWNTVRKNFWNPVHVVEYENRAPKPPVLLSTIDGLLRLVRLIPSCAYQVTLYTSTGRKVLDITLQGCKAWTVNKTLASGVYFMTVKTPDDMIAQKVVLLK
jgi:spore germination protein YaaH